MLYTEFLEGTNAPANEKNFEIFTAINTLYMSSDTMTKKVVF